MSQCPTCSASCDDVAAHVAASHPDQAATAIVLAAAGESVASLLDAAKERYDNASAEDQARMRDGMKSDGK